MSERELRGKAIELVVIGLAIAGFLWAIFG